MENSLVFPQKVKLKITIKPRNSTPRYIPRIENRFSNKYLYRDVHRSGMMLRGKKTVTKGHGLYDPFI